MGRKLDWETIILACQKKHDDYYKYDITKQEIYTTVDKTRIIVECPIHGDFDISVWGHKYGGNGCQKCAVENRAKTRRLNWKEILEDCRYLHNDKFKYDIKKQPIYGNIDNTKMIVECSIHGDFEITVNNHKNGLSGCMACAIEERASNKRLGWEEIFESCTENFNGLYKYYIEEQVLYQNHFMNMIGHCPIHGEFEVTVTAHKHNGVGCQDCSPARKDMNWDIIIPQCIEKHDGFYKYNIDKQAIYVNNMTLMVVECPEHGDFSITVLSHKDSGCGCAKCGLINNGLKRRLNWENIVSFCAEKHKDRYVYDIEEQEIYENNLMSMVVICKKHGEFLISVSDHKSGAGCKNCAIEERAAKRRLGWEEVFEKCRIKHNNRYDYFLDKQTVYKNAHALMVVTCKEHGDFDTAYNRHMYKKSGCSECARKNTESEAVSIIRGLLEKWNIKYDLEIMFDGLVHIKPLRVDIVLEDGRWIEYDGKQHFISTNHWGGEEALKLCKVRDAVKDKFAKDNDIELIRIPYWKKDNLEDILIKELKL